jgi:shikimate kinase
MVIRAVFLVGFMGSGKSSVGASLAGRLRWDFVDLDKSIESREGSPISEIFRHLGEPAFRLAETSALCELTGSLQRDTVVALGGGAFVQQKNRDLIRQWPAVFLEAPLDELWLRSSDENDVRPLRKDREQFETLYAERLPYYRQAALTIKTAGRTLDSICSEIESCLQLTAVADSSVLERSSESNSGGVR